MNKRSTNSNDNPLAIISYSGLLVACILALLSMAACSPDQYPSVSQPVSPPQHILDSPLIGRWRLTDVTVQSEAKNFDLWEPIHLEFVGGQLIVTPERCVAGRYSIVYWGDSRYRLGQSMYPAVECGTSILDDPTVQCPDLVGSNASERECSQAVDKQFGDVTTALRATNTFDVTEDTLILRGEQVEMRLVRDEPSP